MKLLAGGKQDVMATLREYFDTDFAKHSGNAAVAWKGREPGGGDFEMVARLHQDFISGSKFASFYLPHVEHVFKACSEVLDHVQDLISSVEGAVYVAMGYPGEQRDAKTLVFTGTVYIYSEADLSAQELSALKARAASLRQFIELRGSAMVSLRSISERPKAFICHDSMDKEALVRPLAISLSKLNCPIWYDEYSLRVGDSLRESVEKGLKECGKCVIVLSPRFLANGGWSKTEFNSIFTREIIEGKRVILPVWCEVTRQQVYEYSPSLADRLAAVWEGNADTVARKLYSPIMDEPPARGWIKD
jgi:hypothetical protein